jgi:DNA-binding PadR family transcriptional regulator
MSGPDLQLVILALLAEEPRHGYELIKLLEERSGGFYSPSPGVIYPALTYLEEIGYATCQTEGAKKLYSITDAGRAHLEENRGTVDTMLAELAKVGEKMAHIRRAFSDDASIDGDEDDGPRGRSDLRRARHELRAALHHARPSSPEEARRIAEILRRAAAEIRGDE